MHTNQVYNKAAERTAEEVVIMTEKEYMLALGEIPNSRLNQIIYAVNSRLSKEEAGLKGEVEEMFFERLEAEAAAYEKRGGVRPVFTPGEIETEDPCLDIYNKE